MNKTRIVLALSAAIMSGPSLWAQAGNGQPPAGEHRGGWGRGGHPGGGMRELLKGITLTEDQKTKLKALNEQNKAQMDANRDAFKKTMEEAKALREKGDTAGAAAKMQPLMEQRKADMEKRAAEVRVLLTADQQKQFDVNLADWKAKAGKHGKDGRGKGK